jgi:hypothetical protein
MTPRKPPWIGRAAEGAITALLVIGVIGGCGSAGSRSTTPTVKSTATVPADFSALPRYPDSQPVGALTATDGATTQSFKVTDATPQKVMDYYTASLVGWTSSEAPHAVGQGPQSAWRGQWQRSGSTLVVSSEAAPGLGSTADQYSLVLHPA